ncbi:MAG: ribosome maturation factor RimP [Firmicutes bacterium]|jgi:ribosome maturation factor RimP|nr:ribosome maturation factor RimP [Bacillota bacterium]
MRTGGSVGKGTDIEGGVAAIVRPIVEDMGLSLVEASFGRAGPTWVLRVVIFKPSGVDLDDCEAVSRRVSDALDRADIIDRRYVLEVSSPGLERVFKSEDEYRIFVGRKVTLVTRSPVEGRNREISGVLLGLVENEEARAVEGKAVKIATEAGEVTVPLDTVRKARLDEVESAFRGKGGGGKR